MCGPASWNHLIHLDRLPEPVPHMQFATRSVHTVGGTSAGKALHLATLGVDVELHALLGSDGDAGSIERALRDSGVRLVRHHSTETERHVNLMTEAGGRVSLYVSTPSTPTPDAVARMHGHLREADLAIVDLSELGALLLAGRDEPDGWSTPVWTDLHDYDGVAEFHEPFLRAADVVFMNDDKTDDPWSLMRECISKGPRLAVCTLGARGAIALDAMGRRAQAPAVACTVVDTNGAGDAFAAGFLKASLEGADTERCLLAGAEQAVVALSTDHLHPSLGD
ncbi:sugar/nucleoside kinase (ribokinase family) [Homoserinimonas aerilata]|uniref:Sugar/nucleoside kinase (Ribokinase family) n=1 Tax=Homoserinimonas aerilata TaxID=1162970 RepID=A0A542YH36_9MICO|nr:sugar/nucleoside kinase (ribokinase family) [Homoserinimonas aerilata]